MKLKAGSFIFCLLVAAGIAAAVAVLRLTNAASPSPTATPEIPDSAATVGDWSAAIDDYARELSTMPTGMYRDKKDFAWIIARYEDSYSAQNKPVDYAPLQAILNQKLQAHPADTLFTWRLHRALADISGKTQDTATQKAELEKAIAAYPQAVYSDPSKLSSLQHMYNDYAMILAQTDVPAAEDYIQSRFKDDARFLYFFTGPWERLFRERGTPDEFLKLIDDFLPLYDQKAQSLPAQKRLLMRYKSQLEAERRANTTQPSN
jgi:tetratricopeptide (TPR) repeat protein